MRIYSPEHVILALDPIRINNTVSSTVQLSKPALLQVFVEKREDAAPCVVGARLVVGESDNA